MSYSQIASSFVPFNKFQDLAGDWNALLLGPRGSGKTTLFKMLSLDGLRSWNNESGQKYKKEINFSGIYIPADYVWGEMLQSIAQSENNQHENIKEHLMIAAFTTNVLMATADALHLTQEEGQFRSINLSNEQLINIINELAMQWKIEPKTYSFRSIKHALSNRLLDLQRFKALLDSTPEEVLLTSIEQSLPFLGLPTFESVASALKLVNDIANQPDYKWALLFDEFEIAPEALQTRLFQAIRGSGHQHILYKVALAPCGPHTLVDLIENPPTAGNDYKQIQLWYSNKQESDSFCEQLFSSKLKDSIFEGKSPKEILGDSLFPIVSEDGFEETITQDLPSNTKWIKELNGLRSIDSTFQDYLDRKNIVIEELDKSTSTKVNNTIRKISPIVGFRYAFKKIDNGKKKWRKPYVSNYHGWSSISAISEGNPRWLIGIISGILAQASTSNTTGIISTSIQGNHITEASSRYAHLLQTASTTQFLRLKSNTQIFSLLERIGKYFNERIIVDAFVEDPNMSFIVDDKIDSDTENCLRIAINHGAIVCYESADHMGGYKSLIGKRFRLSYLLSPKFSLPIRKSSACNLSTILKIKETQAKVKKNTLHKTPNIEDLFSEDGD